MTTSVSSTVESSHRLAPSSRTPKLVGAAWALLFVNTVGYGSYTHAILPFTRGMAQLVSTGALVVALLLALVCNPRLRIRPAPYLVMLVVLLIVSVASSVTLHSGMEALFRCFRLLLFIATLGLLSPWWRSDLSFVRYTVRTLSAFLMVVFSGLAIAPGTALGGGSEGQGRLVGVLWPIHAPQVGQYGAVLAGLTIILWMARAVDRTAATITIVMAVAALLLSHTRTAAIALVVAIAGALLGLFAGSSRARQATAVAAALVMSMVVFFASAVTAWFERGQDSEQLDNLTGRQVVWQSLLAEQRSLVEKLFGLGLSDKSYNGAPIDSSWLAVYHEQGTLGISVVAVTLVVLLVVALLRPPSPSRACAVFLIVYCGVSSYTEVGLGDASPFLLYLALAASLLVPKADTVGEPGSAIRRPT